MVRLRLHCQGASCQPFEDRNRNLSPSLFHTGVCFIGTQAAVLGFSGSTGSERAWTVFNYSPIDYQFITFNTDTDLPEVLRNSPNNSTKQRARGGAVRLGYIAPRPELTLFSA